MQTDEVVLSINSKAQEVIKNVEKVILGKTGEVREILLSFLSDGHVLLEDVPGVGKTMLARALARSVGCRFSRIQFTPDLLPSDIIGVSIFNQQSRVFEFKPGPIHSSIVLADEINRATPKTQSALLEAMEEHQVTVDGVTHHLPHPFLVIATQNPIEYEGTFQLPESQLDRFFMKIRVGYPDEESEVMMLGNHQLHHPIETLEQVVSGDDIVEMQKRVREIHVDESLRRYIVKIVDRSRRDEGVFLGASPRGSLALFRGAQAEAFLEGRDYVIPDDIKRIARHTLSHRLIGIMEGESGAARDHIVEEILREVPVPE